MYATNHIIDEIFNHIKKHTLTLPKVEEIVNNQNIKYRIDGVENFNITKIKYIIDYLKTIEDSKNVELQTAKARLPPLSSQSPSSRIISAREQAQLDQEEQKLKQSKLEATKPPGGGRKRRSRKREIKRRGRKSRKQ